MPRTTAWACFVLVRVGETDQREPAMPVHHREQPTIARFVLDAPSLPLVTETLPIAEAARRALMSRFQRVKHRREHGAECSCRELFPSRIFSGKDPESNPLKTHGHAYYLPIDEDGDGHVDHLTVYAWDGFGSAEVAALDQFRTLRMTEGSELRLGLVGLGQPGDFNVDFLHKHTTWVSTTPFVVTRHLKKRGRQRDPQELYHPGMGVAFAALVLREELDRVAGRSSDWPPADQIEIEPASYTVPRPFRSLQFKRFRQKSGDDGGRRASGLFRLRFPRAVEGPMALGHSCHFGLGQFLPCDGPC